MAEYRVPLEIALENLSLCTLAVQNAHYNIEPPTDPEQKADLLLAVEDLTSEVLDLLKTTKIYVWGEDEPEDGD
jgi:hypothetical protein